MENAKRIFDAFLCAKGLRHTDQRDIILDTFLGMEGHFSAEEIYRIVSEKNPEIGYATVYRTIKLLCDAGIARGIYFDDGRTRYEHKYGHGHHDHLVCIRCGKVIEIFDPKIEEAQERLAKEKGFVLIRHQLNIFGVCKECRKKK